MPAGVANGATANLGFGSSADTTAICQSPSMSERLAKGLRNIDVRRGGASVHRLSHIAVDLVYVDDADSGFRRHIAVIEHGGYFPVVIRGDEQVRAPHLTDNPSSRCDLGFRGDPRRGRWSYLWWRYGRRAGLLRWWSRRLRACAETAY